jgi:uncharacterized protein (TIGR03067 family)
MNDLKSPHPDVARLTAFAQGRLDEAGLAELSAHFGDCPECRERVEATGDDTLISLLRAADTEHDRNASRKMEEAVTLPPSGETAASPTLPADLAAHGRYRVQELLGVGGMGAVYKAEHLLMERPVALKLISHNLTSKPEMVERFRREVKTAAILKHANIVMAYDAEQAGESHFLVMEYVEGQSLARLVAEHGPLPVRQACDYIRQAAMGLQHAHERGMVHRDIKPQNLMLTPDGQVKVLDFGLARFAMEAVPAGALLVAPALDAASGSESLTQVGTVMGTPDYIAPEQARDAHTADIRADIYSLGCTLYDLLAGHAPFPEGTVVAKVMAHMERSPKPLTALRHDVPPALATVVERMMAKDPAKRYRTPAEVTEALAPFTTGAAFKPRRGWRTRVAAASLLAAVLLAGAVIYVQTDEGEFVITTEDKNIAVIINDKRVKIRDQANDREYLLKTGAKDVRTGVYEIVVAELPEGIEIEGGKTFVVKRGGRAVATARFRQKGNAEATSKVDKELLQGTWQGVAVKSHGQDVKEEEVRQLVVKFVGDIMDVTQPGKHHQGEFSLDPSKSPKRIIVIADAAENFIGMRGVYSLEGNTLKIAMGSPEEGAITDFSGKVGMVATLRRAPADASDQEKIQGTWKPVAASVQQLKMPALVFQAIGPSITFTNNKVIWKANPSPEAKDLFGGMLTKFSLDGVFSLDPTKSPKTIDLTVLGQNAKTPLGTPAPRALLGIYKVEGNTLELCIAIDPEHVEERPRNFEAVPGKFIAHIQLRRDAAPAVPPKSQRSSKEARTP